jgi:hypothetical protein
MMPTVEWAAMYHALDPARISSTAVEISRRISEQFPGSGLSAVSTTLCGLADASTDRAARLARADWRIRVPVGIAVATMVAVAVFALLRIRVDAGAGSWAELAQGLEASVSNVVFFGVAIFFLLSLETRAKRRIALGGLNELRSIAHVIDMHQLTKDPPSSRRSEAAGKPIMSQVDIAQYLDYCSELLAVTSKLAALHIQAFNDPVVIDAVNGIQALTLGLSGKIWQKIMILDLVGSKLRQ